jgi:hypothetical protein
MPALAAGPVLSLVPDGAWAQDLARRHRPGRTPWSSGFSAATGINNSDHISGWQPMSKEHFPLDPKQLPSTQIGSNAQFADLVKTVDCLGRLHLYTKGKAVNRGLVQTGRYGIPESDDEVTDLGDAIDLLPLARRPKAIDMTDSEGVIVSYDPDTAEFKRIAATSLEKESHCMFGPSYLIYERSTGRFLEFFCGNKSSRIEAKNLYLYFSLTQTDIDAKAARGEDVSGLVPHGPLPATLRSRLVEKGTYSWHIPVVVKCEKAFTPPPMDRIVKEIASFLRITHAYPQITEATKKTASYDFAEMMAKGVVQRFATPGGGMLFVFAPDWDKKRKKRTSTAAGTSPGKRLTKGSKGSSRRRKGDAGQ